MPKPLAQVFAANMQRERERQDLSKSALAKLVGTHTSEITRLEQAERDPRLSTLGRVARALGVKPADLLHGAE